MGWLLGSSRKATVKRVTRSSRMLLLIMILTRIELQRICRQASQMGRGRVQVLVRQGRIGQSRGETRQAECGGGAWSIARCPRGAWWPPYLISVYYLQYFSVGCYYWPWETTKQCRRSAAGWLHI